MGQGYVRNDSANNIANGNVIDAADLDGEFDALVAAFDEATGHTHDGTVAEGNAITLTGPAQEYVSTAAALYPKTNATYDLGSVTNNWKDLYASGSITVGGTVDGRDVAADGTKLDAIEAGATADQTAAEIRTLVESATDSNVFTDADHTKLNGIEAGADVTDTTNVTAAGALMDSELTNTTAVKALDQGVASTDSPTFVTINATTINATTFDVTDIEVTNIDAKDGTNAATIADTTGVMTINSAVLTTADINAGTADNVVIGGTTPAAATVTTLNATGGGSLTGTWSDLGTVTTVDINGGTADGVVIGGSSAAAGTFTTLNATGGGSLTGTWSDLGTVTTADINGGTIDGTVIGGTSAAAGTFTNITATGGSITGITDLAVADGGTGASTAADARTNLDVDQAGTALALAIALG